MDKKILNKKIYIVAFPIIIFLYYFPFFSSRIYTAIDEFSILAVPAILGGHDWTPTLQFHSYHGIGFTICLTPIFKLLNNGIVAYRVLLACALLLKILSAEILFKLFSNSFKISNFISFILSMAFVCGVFGGDEYGLSSLSEMPFSFCVIVAVYAWINYIEKHKHIYLILSILTIAYSYTIHSRCLILYIAIILTLFIYIIKERRIEIKIINAIVMFVLSFLVIYFMTQIVQGYVYSFAEGEQLVNEPTMVLAASSYQLKKLLNVNTVFKIIKICLSLTATHCLISLGIGAIALSSCVYVIVTELIGRKYYSKNLFYLSFLALFCVFGMNFAIGIQSVGMVDAGNYRWLTYIRYAEPFWILAYMVMAYLIKEKVTSGFKSIGIISVLITGLFIMLYLVNMLSEGYGLAYSVLNRIFFDNNMKLDNYFAIFIKCMNIVSISTLVLWNSKNKEIWLIILMSLMLLVNNQYIEYSENKEKQEYEEVDASYIVLEELVSNKIIDVIYADNNALAYSSKLQFLCFDKTIQYISCDEEKNGEKYVFFSNIGDYENSNLGMRKIEIDSEEYVYCSDMFVYEYILDYVE